MAETWDETKPAGSRNPLLGDDDIREFKRAMRERLAFDHEFTSTESPAFGAANSKIGTHNSVRLNEQASAPVTIANQGAIYAKEASSVTELFMRGESDATEKQLTRGGCAKLNAAIPFNDGSNDILFPTNGMAAAKIMLGDSNTIAWFYLNTAPPGWKVTATGAGKLLAVAGGALAYNVNGGTDAGTWTQPDHTHTVSGNTGAASVTNAAEVGSTVSVAVGGHMHSFAGTSSADATANTWRPQASVGKLFQLDTV